MKIFAKFNALLGSLHGARLMEYAGTKIEVHNDAKLGIVIKLPAATYGLVRNQIEEDGTFEDLFDVCGLLRVENQQQVDIENVLHDIARTFAIAYRADEVDPAFRGFLLHYGALTDADRYDSTLASAFAIYTLDLMTIDEELAEVAETHGSSS